MLHIDDADRFQKIAAGLQATILSLAVVIGGGWTLYTFNSQLQVENAQAQVQKLRRELDGEPKLEVSIDAKQIESVEKSRYLIVGTVNVRNVGTSNTSLTFDGFPLSVYWVSFEEHGIEKWVLRQRLPLRMSDSKTIGSLIALAGSTNSKPFAVQLGQSGMYAIRLSAARSGSEIDVARVAGARVTDVPVEWEGVTYISVK